MKLNMALTELVVDNDDDDDDIWEENDDWRQARRQKQQTLKRIKNQQNHAYYYNRRWILLITRLSALSFPPYFVQLKKLQSLWSIVGVAVQFPLRISTPTPATRISPHRQSSR